jgi:hypothetical protein
VHKNGKAKPAYRAFKSAAAGIVGETRLVAPFRSFSVTMPVPWVAYHVPAGSKLEVTYTITRNVVNARGRPHDPVLAKGHDPAVLQRNGYVTFTVHTGLDRTSRYTLAAVVHDHKGTAEEHYVLVIS